MYTQELKRITTWVRMGKDEKKWAFRVELVGESMVFYTNKVDKKISSLKRDNFS
jgi:hypothetical protein